MNPAAAATLSARIDAVRTRIARACERSGREPSEITLVAVTKTVPAEVVVEAAACGLADFGENRIQEAADKIPRVLEAAPAPLHFHLIGHLQSNKVAPALRLFTTIHSVDSLRLLKRIAAKVHPQSGPLEMLIQVNISGEASKFGIAPAQLPELLTAAAPLPAIALTGLMTVPPQVPKPELARPFFAALRRLAAEHGLRDLSMGMTDDYEVAVEEGATHLRIGRAIFGER